MTMSFSHGVVRTACRCPSHEVFDSGHEVRRRCQDGPDRATRIRAMPRSRPTPEHLSPGYFAFVMGTGILAIAAGQRGWQTTSLVLLVVAVIGHAVLTVLNVWRAISYREAFSHDLHNSRKAFLVFTFVAGTDVIAAALVEHDQIMVATILLAVGAVSWLLLGYTVPWAAVLGRTERPVTDAANGTWFIWVVAAQSVAVVAATLEPHHEEAARHGLSVLAVFAWSIGVVLYAAVAMLVVQRILHAPLDPWDFDPPYWVSMGAIAIS